MKEMKKEKRLCVMRESSAVYGENREEGEDVSMPRRNKIEIFVDENRMSPRWKKGADEKLVERESAREGEMYRGLDRERKRERETKRKGVAPERRLKCRIEIRSERLLRKDREKDRSFFLFPFFFLSRRQKDREIRSLVPFPIW